jgi:TRAP-type C4-dicarboxylate transport system substrate-binding protein
MKKQTAVEWLMNEIFWSDQREEFKQVIEQALQMEKQQIINAWSDVGADGVTTAEEYYDINF